MADHARREVGRACPSLPALESSGYCYPDDMELYQAPSEGDDALADEEMTRTWLGRSGGQAPRIELGQSKYSGYCHIVDPLDTINPAPFILMTN